MGAEWCGTTSSSSSFPKSPLRQGGLQCLRVAGVCLGHYTENWLWFFLKKGQQENSKVSSYTDVSLWGWYPFSPPFSVSDFTGLDPDLLKSTTTPLAFGRFMSAFDIRIRSQQSILFYFFFPAGFQRKKIKIAALSAHSRAKSDGRVLPKEQCIFLCTPYRIPILCIRIDVETVLINIFHLHFNCLPGCETTRLGKGAFSLVAGVCTALVRLKHPVLVILQHFHQLRQSLIQITITWV